MPPRGRAAAWVTAATVTAAFIGVASRNTVVAVGHGAPDSSAQRAAKLRKDAEQACGQSQWRTCLDRLDEADRLDPATANEPRLQDMRKKAENGLSVRPER